MNFEDIINKIIKELDKEIVLQFLTCREDIEMPRYAHEEDACMDIKSGEDIEIKPNETIIIPTGLKVIVPIGYELQIKARSGISLNTPLRLSNSVGVIDSGYKDELGVLFTNTSIHGEETFLLNEKGNKQGIYKINKGDRIAQISLHKKIKIKAIEIDEKAFNDDETNRNGGFGHSGIN